MRILWYAKVVRHFRVWSEIFVFVALTKLGRGFTPIYILFVINVFFAHWGNEAIHNKSERLIFRKEKHEGADMWDTTIDVNEIKEIRVKVTAYLGVGAISKMDDVAAALKARGVSKALCVTGGRSYKLTGAWDHVRAACSKHGIDLVLYDKVTPNPTTDSIDEAAKLGRDAGVQAVIAIGGGSPIDAGKSAAVLLANPGKTGEELYTGKFPPEKALPIVAINLTHGTGSEMNRFAVATVTSLDYKPVIAADCLYPLFSIDDPGMMTKLSPNQTRFVSVDAVNHVVEAATAITANPLSILLAKETIRLVAEYLPKALENPEDLKARYCLAYAAMMGGTSFDNGMLHLTHALEHPLSAIKHDLSHGLGLAMILPAVVEVCYPVKSQVLAEVLEPIVPGLKGLPEEAHKAAKGVEQWLASVGVTQKLSDGGFGEGDISRLCDLAEQTPSLGLLLSLAPVKATRETIGEIYRKSLKPME